MVQFASGGAIAGACLPVLLLPFRLSGDVSGAHLHTLIVSS
jgi:hypothetical protein